MFRDWEQECMDPRCPGGLRSNGFLVRSDKSMGPKTPLWSKKEVGRVIVPPIWLSRCPRTQMARCLMHVAMSGWCGGVKLEVSAPSHLKNGRYWTLASFGVELIQPP